MKKRIEEAIKILPRLAYPTDETNTIKQAIDIARAASKTIKEIFFPSKQIAFLDANARKAVRDIFNEFLEEK